MNFVIQHSYLIPLLPLIGAVISGFFGARHLKGNSHWPIWITVGISAVLSMVLLFGMLGHAGHDSKAFAETSIWYSWIDTGPVKGPSPMDAGTSAQFTANAGALFDPQQERRQRPQHRRQRGEHADEGGAETGRGPRAAPAHGRAGAVDTETPGDHHLAAALGNWSSARRPLAMLRRRRRRTSGEAQGATGRQPLRPPRDARGVGRDLYRSACLSCHDGDEPIPFGGLPLARSLGLHGESPRNLINVIVHGLQASGNGATTPIMPSYAGALSDAQIEALVVWLRANLTDEAPWPDFRKLVEESRRMDAGMLSFPPGGAGTDPLAARAR